MSKRRRVGLVVIGFALAMSVAGCISAEQGDGSSNAGASAVDNTSAYQLSADERQALRFIREEEKLARDVYTAIGGAHPSFSNIASSEQTHMDAVATLLARYEIDDPVLGKSAGEFTDSTFQELYGDLVDAGSESQVAALQVGVEIEELDIADLARLRAQVTHSDITMTIDNLARGSRNHLRAFYSNLNAVGGSYTPKHLDQASFDAIVNSDKERGGRRGGR